MHRLFRGAFLFAVRFVNELVAFIPNPLADEWCNFMQIPFAFRLHGTLIGLSIASGVIAPVNAFGRRVLKQPRDGLACKVRFFAGAVASIVQKPHDCLFAAVLQKKLIHELPDRAFLGMGYQFFSPFIPKRSGATIGYESFVVVAVKGKGDPNPTVTITTQPESDWAFLGSNEFFSIDAEPWGYLTYQWYLNSKPIPGATSDSLWINNVTKAQAGVYKCAASSGGPAVMSQGALLTIITPISIKKAAGLDHGEGGQEGNIQRSGRRDSTFSLSMVFRHEHDSWSDECLIQHPQSPSIRCRILLGGGGQCSYVRGEQPCKIDCESITSTEIGSRYGPIAQNFIEVGR